MRLLPSSPLLLLCLGCLPCLEAAAARRGPDNSEEPWVFRTVLNDRPRVVVAALGDSAWAAWDTQTCNLYQVWQPGKEGVKLAGAVYTGAHGPQPESDGKRLHEEPAGPAWLVPGGSATISPATVRYRAHKTAGPGRVSFVYEISLPGVEKPVTVEESPSLKPGAAPALVRAFRVSGLPEGRQLALRVSGNTGTWTASGPAAQLKPSKDEAHLVFSQNGEAVLTGVWKTP